MAYEQPIQDGRGDTRMNRFLALAALAAATLLQAACSNNTPGEQQSLVDRAALTVQDMMTQNVSQDPK